MKFKIVKEVVSTKEKTIDITLQKKGKEIYLMAGVYYVLGIKSDGTVESYPACEKAGLNVDDDGHVIIERV